MQGKRLFWSIGALGQIILAFAVWMLVGEGLWRNPEAVSDSEHTVVQPSVVPEVPARPEPTSRISRVDDQTQARSRSVGMCFCRRPLHALHWEQPRRSPRWLTMWMNLSEPALSIVGAIIAGAVIGLEREWRGRAAGLRTHILVSLSSALLMLAAMAQGDWAFRTLPDENIVTDPTRMAHGILTGIGFLCAGVIFRTGFTVHGLTTAASLWITSAIGILFGAGLYGLGTTATITTALILIGLRAINARMPSQTYVDVEVRWRRDSAASEAAVEEGLKAVDPTARSAVFELVDDGQVLRRTWRMQSAGEADTKALAERLRGVDGLIGYRLSARAPRRLRASQP